MPNSRIKILLIAILSSSLLACGTSEISQSPTKDAFVEASSASQYKAKGKPNILLIVSDDLGLDASHQYNVGADLERLKTPTLDSLAANGIVFDNAWATPACTTTRGTLITGQHGINSGVDKVPDLLDSTSLTLQRHLSNEFANEQPSSQYHSAVIGKWHVGGPNPKLNHPNESGVSYFAGNVTGVIQDYNSWTLVTNGLKSQSTAYHTSAITDMAKDWIADQTNPWFMWLAYVAPHSPFHLPPAKLLSDNNLPGTQAHIKRNKRDYYLAAIEAMDTEIGRLLDSLSEEERANTLIIYIGDNGTPRSVIDKNAFTRKHSKSSLYEGGIRVPMTVSGAGVSRAGQRDASLVNTVDVYPTIVEASGAKANTAIDGFSFYSLLSDANAKSRDYNYSEFVDSNNSGWAVRNQSHKLIEYNSGTKELYSLENDIKEENNLIANSESDYESLVAELSNFAAMVRNHSGSDFTSNDSIDISNAILTNQSPDCTDYAKKYSSTALDKRNNKRLTARLVISVDAEECVFSTNGIPNHTFHDTDKSFPHDVSAQSIEYRVPREPTFASEKTGLLLTQDNAMLLNGVKVDILAAGCFGVGDERTGCNDINADWRFDPMYSESGFRVDTHNAHTQPNGAYHYHGNPNALFNSDSVDVVVGFAADGFPIFSSFIEDNGNTRKIVSSFQLKNGSRPSGQGNPGGTYNGQFRDDYEYISGSGDLDECNGATRNGSYGYYITDGFPYVLSCFKGTPNDSFNKRTPNSHSNKKKNRSKGKDGKKRRNR